MATTEAAESSEPTPIQLTTPITPTPQPLAGTEGIESKRILAAGFAFMTGAFGVHKFILGQTREGFIRLAITFLLIWTILAPVAMMVIGMVEGFIYFSKTDDEFIRTYQQGHKNWF